MAASAQLLKKNIQYLMVLRRQINSDSAQISNQIPENGFPRSGNCPTPYGAARAGPWAPHGPRWVHMDPYGPIWIHMGPIDKMV